MTEREKIQKIKDIYQNFLQQWHRLKNQAQSLGGKKNKNSLFKNKKV